MRISDKFMMRRYLSIYAEMKFAKAIGHKYKCYFPEKDEGIDVLAVDKRTKRYTPFQVKARNPTKYGDYWFQIHPEKVKKSSENPRMQWAFGIVRSNALEFVVIPVKKIEGWMAQSRNNRIDNVLSGDKDFYWFKIVKKDDEYLTNPIKGRQNLTRYSLDKFLR